MQGRFQFKRESLPVAVSARILQPQAQRSLPVLFSEVEVDTAFFTCDQGCRSTQLASTYLGPQDVSGGGVCRIVLPELARPLTLGGTAVLSWAVVQVAIQNLSLSFRQSLAGQLEKPAPASQ